MLPRTHGAFSGWVQQGWQASAHDCCQQQLPALRHPGPGRSLGCKPGAQPKATPLSPEPLKIIRGFCRTLNSQRWECFLDARGRLLGHKSRVENNMMHPTPACGLSQAIPRNILHTPDNKTTTEGRRRIKKWRRFVDRRNGSAAGLPRRSHRCLDTAPRHRLVRCSQSCATEIKASH